jgi:SAM-dependent methyltransferase
LFVPALFGQWAPKVVSAARIQPGQRVLDVACGTGVLAREALARAGSAGQVVGFDPIPGMLAVAKQIAPEVEWKEGLAESLPFADQSFDVVVSQFGLMFFSDRQQAIRETLRVLTTDGRVAFAVWDSLETNPAYAAEVNLLQQLAGERAADAVRAPFVLGDRSALEMLFKEAGVASVEVTTHRGTGRFPSIRSMVEADLRGWLPVMGVMLSEPQIVQILEEAEQALGQYVDAEGSVVFDVSAHIITGSRS